MPTIFSIIYIALYIAYSRLNYAMCLTAAYPAVPRSILGLNHCRRRLIERVRRTGIVLASSLLALLTINSLPPPRPKPNLRGLNCDAREAGTLPPTLDHWSGGFSQWGQSLRPCPKGPTFPRYRGHPKGFSRVPGTWKGSIHPQKSPFQMLELQGKPPTPGHPGVTQWPNWSILLDLLEVGIIMSFFQNYHETPWCPCFNLKLGIIWSFPKIFIRHPGGTQWPNWSNFVSLAGSRYYMVIFSKLSSDTLVPLFQA